MFMIILPQLYPWTRKNRLNFRSHPDGVRIHISEHRMWTPDPDQIHLGGGLRSPSALVVTATVWLQWP